MNEFTRITSEIGPELEILTNIPEYILNKKLPKNIAQAIINVRKGNVKIIPGFDGIYGKILLRSIAKSKYWPEMRFFFSSMYERYCACLLREVVKIVSETDGVESGISEEAFDLNVSFYGLLFYTYMEKWFFEGIKIPKEQFFKNCIIRTR